MIQDNMLMAARNLWERKSRSALTLLGICIGIMAIIALLGIGEGMQNAVTGELSSLSDTIFLTTSTIEASPVSASVGLPDSNDPFFTDRDIASISRIQGVDEMSPISFYGGLVTDNGETQMVTLVGISPTNMKDIFGISSLGIAEGVFPEEGDQKKCVVGHKIAYDTFKQDIEVGGIILINDEKFYVSGIYKEHGMGLGSFTDDAIQMSNRDLERATGHDDTNTIIVRVSDINEVDRIAYEMEAAVNQNHGSDEFAQATSMSSILDSINSVLSIVQMVLLAIASIALLVASIGIMNTMMTSVMERTREIGIMKAIGARNNDILMVFIMEGLLISIIGGILGSVFGVVVATGSGMLLSSTMGDGASLTAIITPFSIVLGMGVSVLVGILSSVYPAYKAARMSPIEAVRYE